MMKRPVRVWLQLGGLPAEAVELESAPKKRAEGNPETKASNLGIITLLQRNHRTGDWAPELRRVSM